MTTPQEFYANVMDSLNYLDSGVLPMGSHMVFLGVCPFSRFQETAKFILLPPKTKLVDARILWDHLANKLNPIGRTYEKVYTWLSCLGVNPCWQWLNANETIRNIASARAAELTAVFQMVYNSLPLPPPLLLSPPLSSLLI